MTQVLIFGCGYSGKAIARLYSARGIGVGGTTRSVGKFASVAGTGATALLFDGSLNDALSEALAKTTHLILSISPDNGGDPSLALLGDRLKDRMPRLQWGAYLSTVGVYGDHDGAWVDEETPCRPVSSRSVARVEAEGAWAGAFSAAGLPLAILRLSGIYGPGRNQIRTAMEGGARRLVKPGQVFNRIRVEDIAAATLFLADRGLGGIYNITDHEPAPPQDVVAYACTLAHVPLPPEQDFATAELTPMARSFYGENKRVSNAKVTGLGFRFGFPNYRVSLEELWETGRWKGG
jgi:hypothetical protein